jgi:predicted CXXCH cytochrome family protein
MKKAMLFLMVALLAGAAFGQTVVGSKHDLRATGGGTPTGNGLTEVCVVCHTPHQTTSANSQDPLWNRTLSSTASYGVYASATLNATPTDVGGGTLGSASTTSLCLSCHDGTVSVLSMLNPPNSGTPTVTALANRITAAGLIDPANTAYVGTSLTNDHPVNFTYDTALATADGGLHDPATTAAVAALIPGGTVQCSSCHDVHNPTNVPFLVMSNAASALCTTCHTK